MGTLLLAWMAFVSPAFANGKLVVCDDVKDPLTLDPHKQFSEKNHTIVQQLYEGLIRFDPDGKIEPALAVSWERKDPLRMRFHLRQGVLFHNGEPFNAEAVRFTIQRYLNPTTGFPALGFISSLDKAEAVDPQTVDIITKYPDGLLLNRLAGFILIVPPDYLQKNGEAALSEHPIGTGPFRFERWDKGRQIVLTANPEYWGKPRPWIGELIFRFVPIQEQVNSLLKGSVDILTDLPGTETTRARQMGLQVVKMPSFYTYGASFNISQPPLSDVRVRQALNYAVDREELIHYDALGNGISLASLTMAGEGGHNGQLTPYPHDPQKARQLLKEAGYSKGFDLNVFVKVQSERTFRILKKMIGAIGIKLHETVVSDADMFKQLQAQKWDIVFGDCPDPMAHAYFIQAILLYSQSPFSVMKNPDYDRLLEKASGTLDPAERDAVSLKVDQYIHDNALSLFTYQRIRTYGMARNVHFKPWITGMPYFDQVTLDNVSQERRINENQ